MISPIDAIPPRASTGARLAPDAEAAAISRARAGDAEAFRNLTEGYRRELHVHCYRFLGSFQEAEEAVQDALLRAWRHLETFEGRSSFRAWLYRIATNVCLKQRSRRATAPMAMPKASEVIPATMDPESRRSPYPDVLLDELESTVPNPAVQYDMRESVQLAFLAAVQLLPPRQRAVLILHDVLGFPASEVAEMLDASVASVNSALNRARSTLQKERAAGRLHIGHQAPSDATAESLVRRYVEAWVAVDIVQLASLFRGEVTMTMPPLRLRYVGKEAVVQFLATIPPAGQRRWFRFVPTRANRQPALAVYRLDPDSDTHAFRAWAIFVFTLDGDSIAEFTAFIAPDDPSLLSEFGMPPELSGDR